MPSNALPALKPATFSAIHRQPVGPAVKTLYREQDHTYGDDPKNQFHPPGRGRVPRPFCHAQEMSDIQITVPLTLT